MEPAEYYRDPQIRRRIAGYLAAAPTNRQHASDLPEEFCQPHAKAADTDGFSATASDGILSSEYNALSRLRAYTFNLLQWIAIDTR